MNKTLILVVEDDRPIRNLIVTTLKTHDYKYLAAENGASAILEASSHNPDIVLLDLGLPDMEGVEVIKKIRTWSNMPIIVISARSEDVDKIEALDAGADDYVTKPFGMMELVSRVKAVLRRSRRDDKKDEIIVGDLKIYPNKHKVKSCGNEVTLTNKEFKLLCLLVESKGNVLNRDQLLTNIWGYDFDGETRTVDVHIRSLRHKLGECGKLIETGRGIGYRIGGSE